MANTLPPPPPVLHVDLAKCQACQCTICVMKDVAIFDYERTLGEIRQNIHTLAGAIKFLADGIRDVRASSTKDWNAVVERLNTNTLALDRLIKLVIEVDPTAVPAAAATPGKKKLD